MNMQNWCTRDFDFTYFQSHVTQVSRILLYAVFILLYFVWTSASGAASTRIAPSLEEIKNAKKIDNPALSSGALVLYKQRNITSHGDGKVTDISYVAVSILDKAAADDYSQISIHYDDFYTDIQLDFAYVHTVAGITKTISKDAIQIKTQSNDPKYNDERFILFSLPSIEEGAVIEYQFTEKRKRALIENNWYSRYSFYHYQELITNKRFRADPVVQSHLFVESPFAENIQYSLENHAATPTVSVSGATRIHHWHLQDLEEIKVEDNMEMLSSFIPLLHLSTLSSWQDVDKWSANLYLADKMSNEIDVKAIVDLNDQATLQEKVKNIFYFMQDNIRYIYAHVGSGGYIPHQPKEVLENKYGDCKDQTILMVNLLRSAGIPAFPALVGVFPDSHVNESIPGLFFSHMITYIPDDAGGIWLDTSGWTGQYPGISWALQGRTAFVVNGNGGMLKKVTKPIDSINSVNLDAEFIHGENQLDLNFQMTADGDLSSYFKSRYRNDVNAEHWLRQIVLTFYPTAEIQNVRVENVDNFKESFGMSATAVFPFDKEKDKDLLAFSGNINPMLSVFTSLTQLPTPQLRVNDSNFGMTVSLNMQTKIKYPEDEYQLLVTRDAHSIDNEYFKTEYSLNRMKGDLQINQGFLLKTASVKRGNYDYFYDKIKQANEQSIWQLQIVRNKNERQLSVLEKHAVDEERSEQSLIGLARHHLSIADYEKARDIANEIIGKSPNHAEAHYLLGLALGFLDEFSSSESAIKKARELGYKPY